MKIKAEFKTHEKAKTYNKHELLTVAPDGVYATEGGRYRVIVCQHPDQRCALYVSDMTLEPLAGAGDYDKFTPTNETMSIVFSKE